MKSAVQKNRPKCLFYSTAASKVLSPSDLGDPSCSYRDAAAGEAVGPPGFQSVESKEAEVMPIRPSF